jgi:hypothetical protein
MTKTTKNTNINPAPTCNSKLQDQLAISDCWYELNSVLALMARKKSLRTLRKNCQDLKMPLTTVKDETQYQGQLLEFIRMDILIEAMKKYSTVIAKSKAGPKVSSNKQIGARSSRWVYDQKLRTLYFLKSFSNKIPRTDVKITEDGHRIFCVYLTLFSYMFEPTTVPDSVKRLIKTMPTPSTFLQRASFVMEIGLLDYFRYTRGATAEMLSKKFMLEFNIETVKTTFFPSASYENF